MPNIEVDTKEQVARHNQPNIDIPGIYIHTHDKQTTKYSNRIPTTSEETTNKYDTGNYNYRSCIKNTTAVWNLTPPSASIALIPQQHVIHQASKYKKVDITDIEDTVAVATTSDS